MRPLRLKIAWPAVFLLLSPGAGFPQTASAQDFLRLWDTKSHSQASLKAETVAKKEGWKPITYEKAQILGDICLVNNHLALVLRKAGQGLECYYRLGEEVVKGPTLIPFGEGEAKTFEEVKIAANTSELVVLEAAGATQTGQRVAVRYRLRKEKPFVEVEPAEGAKGIFLEARSKHAILPDVRGGDLVVSADETQSPFLRFPSENMILLLAEGGNSIVMAVWRLPEQRVSLTLEGTGESRAITKTSIAFCKDKGPSIWVGVLAAPGIWHQQKISELSPTKDKKLDWRVPFPALWKANLRRTDGLIDSWRLPIKVGAKDYEAFGVGLKDKRTVWASARGTYAYPGYIEGEAAYLRASRFESLPDIRYKGDAWAVLYPLQKASKTPAVLRTPLDLLVEALADTPEARLPDDLLLKHVARDKYPATCSVTEQYEKIFDANEEKVKKPFLLERLEAMHNFVVGIRSRIDEYMNWKRKMLTFMAEQKARNPSVTPLADEFSNILTRFDRRYEDLKLAERTPAAADALIEEVKALIDSNEPNKAEKAKQLGRATRTIGGSQDHAIGDFRLMTKELRQRAGYRMIEARDDASFEFARTVRDCTLEMLQNYFGHEGPYTN